MNITGKLYFDSECIISQNSYNNSIEKITLLKDSFKEYKEICERGFLDIELHETRLYDLFKRINSMTLDQETSQNLQLDELQFYRFLLSNKDKNYLNLILANILECYNPSLSSMPSENLYLILKQACYLNCELLNKKLFLLLNQGKRISQEEYNLLPQDIKEFYDKFFKTKEQIKGKFKKKIVQKNKKERLESKTKEKLFDLSKGQNLEGILKKKDIKLKTPNQKEGIKKLRGFNRILVNSFINYIKENSSNNDKKLKDGIWVCPLEEKKISEILLSTIEGLFKEKADGKSIDDYVMILCVYFYVLGICDLDSCRKSVLEKLENDENKKEKELIWNQLLENFTSYQKLEIEPRSCHAKTFIKLKIEELQEWSKQIVDYYEKNSVDINM